jgi:hypothetical protein
MELSPRASYLMRECDPSNIAHPKTPRERTIRVYLAPSSIEVDSSRISTRKRGPSITTPSIVEIKNTLESK